MYMHFILSFKYHVFNAWRWSERTEEVACVEGTHIKSQPHYVVTWIRSSHKQYVVITSSGYIAHVGAEVSG
jgi:hypothetical protein